MFGFGKKKREPAFDLTEKAPAIRTSICTGEKVAGYKDLKTGKFHELMLIRGDRDMKEFLRTYGVEESQIQWML